MSQSLFTLGQFFFNPATSDQADCATFTYKVVFGEPEQEFFPDVYNQILEDNSGQFYLQGTPATREPFVFSSPFYIRIRADFGAYGSVLSEAAKLTIRDPCFETVIEPQTIENMLLELNAEEPLVQLFGGFKDSVSLLYSDEYGDGTGCDICAP